MDTHNHSNTTVIIAAGRSNWWMLKLVGRGYGKTEYLHNFKVPPPPKLLITKWKIITTVEKHGRHLLNQVTRLILPVRRHTNIMSPHIMLWKRTYHLMVIRHDLNIIMQKSHKSKLRNILQNTWPVLLKSQVHKSLGKTEELSQTGRLRY